MIESRDVMLFISYSGGAKELDLIIPRLEDKSVALLAMTGNLTLRWGERQKPFWIFPSSVKPARCIWRQRPVPSIR